ncbi:hypothetical protein J5N97_029418 [Dioscorea zingiberensis]|uniref:Uncharacterized protein n=1 Tax=Dioscorea zingiberensis TaxID=325984 RepID=A0A9D5C089_9LILI|nr:hypothetical protein J5N97_029418 [Dioscorea zingiberensis]
MSLEHEDKKSSLESSVDNAHEPRKKSGITYTREFLLSLSNLDVCKKLPSGFDVSILSEFEDASQRSFGGLSFQSSRRNDHGSLPSRMDNSGSYSRGSSGRWDTYSSGSSDKDGDLQLDRENCMQDSGRHVGNQPRRPWQLSEHDGLLGSGAFPRSSGYSGASGLKGRDNGHHQLSKSTDTYQPPRTYKAVPNSRKDHTDLVNDETFGSSECSSQDRAEEERRRRESFELMRKEQKKSLKDNQKHMLNIDKENVDDDIMALLGSSEGQKSKQGENKLVDSVALSNSRSDSSRSSHIHAPPSRPLVPPGFASAAREKNLHAPSSNTCTAKPGSAVIDKDNSHVNQPDSGDSGAGAIKQSVYLENISNKTFNIQEADDALESGTLNDFSNAKESRHDIIHVDTQDQSASILDKLFGSALLTNFRDTHNVIEHQGVEVNVETRHPAMTESSKFTNWFRDEEKKPVENVLSKDLLSLIVSKEKASPQVSEFYDGNSPVYIKPSLLLGESGTNDKHLKFPDCSSVGIPELQYPNEGNDSSSGVITCEDLEQLILAEVKDSNSGLEQFVLGPQTELDSELEGQKTIVDDSASKHLLSLLHKGGNSNDQTSSSIMDVMGSSINRIDLSDAKATPEVPDRISIINSNKVQNCEKTVTLEALFGSAFMDELHSVEAPLSVQRGPIGGISGADTLQSLESQLQYDTNHALPSTYGLEQPNKITNSDNVEAFIHSREARTDKIPGLWVGGDNSSPGGSKIHLPEEDGLIMFGDSLNSVTSDSASFRSVNRDKESVELNPERLQGQILKAIHRDTGHAGQVNSSRSTLVNCPPDLVDLDRFYDSVHGRASTQYSHPLNHMRPLFPEMDQHTNLNSQMRSIAPENIHPDSHLPFPVNVFPQHGLHSANGPQFDHTGHHPTFQHVPVPGNLPPPHPLLGLPRGFPPSYPMNHMPGYIAEMNNMHGLPQNLQPHTFGNHGMGMPGSLIGGDGGSNPQAFNRLIEMELRAKSKQIHSASGHIPGFHGPELDAAFRYR